ncbi:MAG: transposase [Nitrospirae bacterium]|nr:transposase [Nitrospirota bacterium]
MYLTVEDIEHSYSKVKSLQSNGICELFHKTVLEEFYNVAFHKKIYHSIEQLQKDLDDWLDEYNHMRTHQGKHCNGLTPMECFTKNKHLAQIKMIGYDNESDLQTA